MPRKKMTRRRGPRRTTKLRKPVTRKLGFHERQRRYGPRLGSESIHVRPLPGGQPGVGHLAPPNVRAECDPERNSGGGRAVGPFQCRPYVLDARPRPYPVAPGVYLVGSIRPGGDDSRPDRPEQDGPIDAGAGSPGRDVLRSD